MSLPKRYGERIKEALKVDAAWLPGKPFTLGTIVGRKDGVFFPKDHLSNFGNPPIQEAAHSDKSLDLCSKGVRTTLFQAGVELPDSAELDLAAEAKLKIEFSREFEYMLKTPILRGRHITNLNQIAQAVHLLPNWDHGRFWVVHETYDATEFSFLGSEQKSQNLEISGKGSAILSFLSAGASVGITATGNVSLKLIGAGGTVAIGLVRIEEDGQLDFE